MKNIAAYLLLQLGGKATPTAADITSVLEAAGAEVDSSRIEKLISELEGKDINEVRRPPARCQVLWSWIADELFFHFTLA
jgi:ribosomal protein L12E/L44/L45/RPP1/RPP2